MHFQLVFIRWIQTSLIRCSHRFPCRTVNKFIGKKQEGQAGVAVTETIMFVRLIGDPRPAERGVAHAANFLSLLTLYILSGYTLQVLLYSVILHLLLLGRGCKGLKSKSSLASRLGRDRGPKYLQLQFSLHQYVDLPISDLQIRHRLLGLFFTLFTPTSEHRRCEGRLDPHHRLIALLLWGHRPCAMNGGGIYR
jgi:hypothetical protein